MDNLAFLNVPGAPPPPPTAAYSHAVRAGDFLFVTGQLGVDPRSNTLVPGGAVAQTRQVMENLKTVLAGAGTSLGRAVMVRIYLTDFSAYPAMNAEYARHCSGLPAGPNHRGCHRTRARRRSRDRPDRSALAKTTGVPVRFVREPGRLESRRTCRGLRARRWRARAPAPSRALRTGARLGCGTPRPL
jgi:2-iminobutanoate/2-iminopropanoate deaminase